jgi:drug/metabolite transporter (DMT)-like permease
LSVAACLGAGLCLAAQGALWSRYAQPRSLATDAGVFFVAQFVATVLLVLPVIVARPAILTAHLEGDDEAGQLVAANSGDAFAVASLGDGGPTSRRSWVVLALPYALAGALCYCIGLGGQVVGLLALPESVAMPLTQLNVIVAGLWGIAYYREIESPRLIYVFVGAVLLDVVGAALLGIELSQI